MNYNSWHKNDSEGCAWILLAAVLIIALAFLNPVIVMWLWNWIAVELFTLPAIGYWQAFGLHWLCGILFRSRINVRHKG